MKLRKSFTRGRFSPKSFDGGTASGIKFRMICILFTIQNRSFAVGWVSPVSGIQEPASQCCLLEWTRDFSLPPRNYFRRVVTFAISSGIGSPAAIALAFAFIFAFTFDFASTSRPLQYRHRLLQIWENIQSEFETSSKANAVREEMETTSKSLCFFFTIPFTWAIPPTQKHIPA